MTRLEMALAGREAAADALLGRDRDTSTQQMGLEDYETGLVDVLTNLRHYAERYNIEFHEQLDRSYEHYLHEREFDWHEETT